MLVTTITVHVIYFLYDFQAARDGRLDLVEKKLQLLGKNSSKISTQDKDGSTALHYAVRYNHFNIVKKLVEWGACKCRIRNVILNFNANCDEHAEEASPTQLVIK